MSRSRKKSPFRPVTTTESEKQDKRDANRLDRRVNKYILRSTEDDERLRSRRETSDPWAMGKDGMVRFDPSDEPQYLRK